MTVTKTRSSASSRSIRFQALLGQLDGGEPPERKRFTIPAMVSSPALGRQLLAERARDVDAPHEDDVVVSLRPVDEAG